jgi:hypothetical protein
VWPKVLELWELITKGKQHKIGKGGGDFLRKPRPDKGCSTTDDDDDERNNHTFTEPYKELPFFYVISFLSLAQ